MQTALQELIEHIEKCQNDNFISDVEYIKEKAVELLQSEEAQITLAYKIGGDDILKDTSWHNETFLKNAGNYFKHTFNNKKFN